jgi:signal transduction histidine kinase
MIKKLKRRLIINNMLILSVVFFILLIAFSILIYISEEIKISNELEDNISSARENLLHSSLPSIPTEDKLYDVSFTVFIDNSDKVVSLTSTNLNQEDIEDAILSAVSSDMQRGNLKFLNSTFLKEDVKEGTIISFVSREHLQERLKENIIHTLITMFVSLVVFFFISKRFANIAVTPVEKAWEQQKQFIADASHDLKTPLTVILANNNIVSANKDKTVESQMKWIESTSEEAGRMSDLINKMLELAKSEATKEELKIGEVDLSEVVENSILQFEVVAFERNIQIESGIQPNIIVRTHAPTFSKVLEILFDNAIKYSDENGKINITLYQTSKKAYFTINNKGEYIKPEDIPHVFERFYRTSKERTVGGHGLGLSLAKKKCDMIGCKLSVESNEDDGTTFTITLKARKQK